MKKRHIGLGLLLGAGLALLIVGCARGSTPSDAATAPASGITATIAPSPDPRLGCWETTLMEAEDTEFLLELKSDGSYLAALQKGDTVSDAVEGRWTMENDVLRIGGREADITADASGDGSVLSLRMDGETLALRRAEAMPDVAEAIAKSLEGGETKDAAGPVIEEIYARGAIVHLRIASEAPLDAYCFSRIGMAPAADSYDWIPAEGTVLAVYKADGDYSVFVRDTTGAVSAPAKVTVESGLNYVYAAAGLTPIATSLDAFLASQGGSIDALNARIAESTAEAGMYTPAAAAVAGVTLVSELAAYGATVPYQSAGRYRDEDMWGALADWGAELERVQYDNNGSYHQKGLHCAASTMWAYKQAGLNLATKSDTNIERLGTTEGATTNKCPLNAGKTGDMLCSFTTHTMMVLDRLDTDADGETDAYLVLEMVSPNLTLQVYSFKEIRPFTMRDMSAVFSDTSRNRSDVLYWENTMHIPAAAWPAYLTNAVNEREAAEAKLSFARRLGLHIG